MKKYWFWVVWCLACAAGVQAAATRQLLKGQVPAVVPGLHPIGNLPGTQRLNLAIGLPLRNTESLTNLLQQLYDPDSPNYRQFLTPDQFTAMFGPDTNDYQAVIAFAQANGLTVTGTHPNRMIVNLAGPVAQIERVFNVHLRVFQHPTEARTFYAPDSNPSVNMGVPILNISGLDNYVLPHTADLKFLPGRQPTPNAQGSGPGGYYLGYDFRRAYAPNVPQIGTGQKVALVEFDGYYPGDVSGYESLAGLPSVAITNILLDGFNGIPGADNDEVSLDIDMSVCMAPGLDQVCVYEGFFPDNVLNRIATDNQAKQISSSWTFSSDATIVQILQQYALQGQSYFNASGDSGAYAGTVPTPADNPYVTVAGGTQLTMTPGGGTWVSETTWPLSSGGVSTVYPIPTWQQGIDMTANHGSTTMRNLPDVAMVADEVWLIANNGQQGIVGGTSISAPLWAGFAALVNQLALANGEPAVGFINPALYGLARSSLYGSVFHDITTGNNQSTSNPTNFPAVAGYDLCTGWGTPTGSNLMYALGVPEPLRIFPEAPLFFTGPVGGPFTPASQTWTLTNHSGAPLSWSLGQSGSLFNASQAGGTLTNGGAAATLAVTPTLFASNSAPGFYTNTFWFTNTSDQFVVKRQALLAVVTPPAITSQPVSQAVFEGSTATFSVGTASNAVLYFQWRQDNGSFLTNLSDGPDIFGSGTSSLTISNVSASAVGAYSVVISNAAGVTVSSNAFLAIVPWRPVITQQPASQTVLPGAPVSFSVGAIGTRPYTYHWRFNGTDLTDDNNISGSATATLSLQTVTVTNLGVYSVVVSNNIGSDTSTGAALALTPVTAPGVTLTPLHSFSGGLDGAFPFSPVLQGTDGALYGTTSGGGPAGMGVVFRMTTNGDVTTLHSFLTVAGGEIPYGGLLQATNGLLYGLTSSGGQNGQGTAFRVTTNGTFALLTSFSFNDVNGGFPVAGLAQGADGNFHGATFLGGVSGGGSVFSMTSAGVLSLLASFNIADGANPSCVLAQTADGSFYGTAESGGTASFGTVFRLNASGAFTSLHSFKYSDGATPVPGLVQDTDGSFYGTTEYGGTNGYGTVFQLDPDGSFKSLYSFTGGSDGAYPFGGLVLGADGNIYGTTSGGGTYGGGTVFRLAPRNGLTTLVEFDGFQGLAPAAAMIQSADGNLYGTTEAGGLVGGGTVFRLSIAGALQITSQPVTQMAFTGDDVTFSVATFGSLPVSYQWRRNGQPLTNGGNIFGVNSRSLVLSNITIADAATYSVVVSNSFGALASSGAALQIIVSPPVILTDPADQTVLVGSTATFSVEAEGDEPLTYQWQKNGTNLGDGQRISGSGTSVLSISGVTAADDGVYSVVVGNLLEEIASSDAVLTVVPVTAPGAALATVRSFTAGDGANPYAGLVQGPSGALYGTTLNGGFVDSGTAFSYVPGGAFTMLHQFTGSTEGGNPYAGLTIGPDQRFYGAGFVGGSTYSGALFSMTASGSVQGLYSFTGAGDGLNPVAAPTVGPDGKMYGTTYQGGTNGYGTAFRFTTNGTFATIASFNGANGSSPAGPLIVGMDGSFYGSTQSGGAQNYGTIFNLTTNGSITTLYAFSYGDGAFPYDGLVQSADGSFYGTTSAGGTNGYGTVFRLTGDGMLTTLYSFNNSDGANPAAGLVFGTDGNLYGTTSLGGLGGQGSAFQITTNGVLTTLVWFNGTNGANPQAPLMQAADGSFYGTTSFGGVDYNGAAGTGDGTVFQIIVPMFKRNPFAQATAIASAQYFGTLATNATAPGGDTLTFAKISGPAWLAVAANGTLSGVPPYSSIGTNVFVVGLSDSSGWSSQATMYVAVVNSPWITAAILRQAGKVLLTWSGGQGPYQVQTAGTLRNPAWVNVGGPVGTNGLLLTPSNNAAFYRVVGH